MSKAYKVTKRTVMFDKKNPKTVYSVSPVNYGTLTTDDVANQSRLPLPVTDNTDPDAGSGSGSDTIDPGSSEDGGGYYE